MNNAFDIDFLISVEQCLNNSSLAVKGLVLLTGTNKASIMLALSCILPGSVVASRGTA